MKKLYFIIILYLSAAVVNAQRVPPTSENNQGATIELHQKNNQSKAATVPFITTWKTDNPGTSNDDQITIPIVAPESGETFDLDIDWGDGQSDLGVSSTITHTYASVGTYQISITGVFPRIQLGLEGADSQKLIELNQWGNNEWTTLFDTFAGCSNMVYKAEDAPDLSLATSIRGVFYSGGSFETTLNNWDVSTITNMVYAFSFSSFNGNINNWNVSNVTNMNSMFWGSPFNQPLDQWNVSNVTDFGSMFLESPFNQDISAWDVSSAIDMSVMFKDTPFDRPLNNWNVSAVTDMNSMFWGSPFNQSLDLWNVSNVVNMQGMFRNSDFNQDISSWDVSNVTNMGQMFEASEFSYDIGNWNTASLQLMGGIFYDVPNFDYDIGSWDISQVTDLAYSLSLSGLSVANYDKTLKGWAAQTVQPDQDFNGGGLFYCSADLERNILIDQGWVFDGDDSDCTPLLAYDFTNGDLINNIGEFLEPNNFGASPSFDRFGNDEQAYAFDGVNDYMVVEESGSIESVKQTFSFATWIRLEDIGTNFQFLLENYDGSDGYYAYFVPGDNGYYDFRFRIFEGGKEAGFFDVNDALKVDEWAHIVVTSDQDEGFKYYLNNRLLFSNNTPFSASVSSSSLNHVIGYSLSFDNYNFAGSLDQIRLYDYQLDVDNVAFLYYENGGPNYVWAQYDFDGDYLDKSGFIGNDPVGTNTPGFGVDRFMRQDSALSLNQLAGEYLEYGWSFSDNQPFSISAWVNWQGGNNDFQNIVSWYDDITGARTYFGVNNLGQLRFGDPYGDTGIDMPQNEWVHLVATYDGNVSKIYLNNELAGTSDQGKSYTFGNFWVGTLIDGLELWNGLIDDLKIYPRAITPYNVNDLFKENGFGVRPQSGPSNPQLVEVGPNLIQFNFSPADEEVDGYIAVRSSTNFVAENLVVDGQEYEEYYHFVEQDARVVYTLYDSLVLDNNPQFPLSPLTDYYYRVWAYNGDGVSRKYSLVSTTFSHPTTAAVANDLPKNLRVDSKTSNSVTISFDLSTDESVSSYLALLATTDRGIAIERANIANAVNYSVGDTFDNQEVVYTGTSNSFTISGLSEETTYELSIAARTGAGNTATYAYNSAFSNFSFTTLASLPDASPTNLNFPELSESGLSASFDDVFSGANDQSDSVFVFNQGFQEVFYFVSFTFGTTVGNQFFVDRSSTEEIPRIQIRFGDDKNQMAHRSISSEYVDYVNVPFEVWDVDNEIQLNISFNDSNDDGIFDLADTSNNEYFSIHNSVYDQNTADESLTPLDEPTYLLWPRVLPEANWDVSNIPEVNINLGYYYLNQRNYLVLRSSNDDFNQGPVNGFSYNIGDIIGNAEVIYNGREPNFEDVELSSETTYHYAIYAYGGEGLLNNYRISDPLIGSITTLAAEPANQPASINFQDVSFNDLKLLFSGNGADGYLVIARNDEAVDFVPEDGVTYELDDLVGANTDQVVIGNSGVTNLSHINLTSGDTYHYAIYAFNGSGAITNYNVESPLKGQATTLEDNTLPVLGTVSFDDEVVQGESNDVSITVVDAESGLSAVRIFYTTPDVGDYSSANAKDMSPSGDQYSFTLPDISNKGMEFKIEATNGLGNTITTEAYNVRTIFTGAGLSIPYNAFGTDQSNYRIVSIPLVLDDNTVDNVFGNAFGPYDNTKWRMFRYQNGANSELSGTSSLLPGNGYWLLASQQASLNTGTGTSLEASTEEFYEIILKPGWNQIGNPYAYDVSWNTVQTFNDIAFPLRGYNGNWVDLNTLSTFSGGFVNNTTGGDIEIKIPTGDFATTATRDAPIANGWELPLNLSSGNHTFTFGGVGMREDASDLADEFDQYSLPRLEKYLELNHSRKLKDYAETMSVVASKNQFEWSFQVNNNLTTSTVNMQWNIDLIVDLPFELYLWDELTQRAIDMKSTNSYRFANSANNSFKIFYGETSFIKEKTKVNQFVFYSMYPNPTKDQVNLEFYVPESAIGQSIEVQIFNVKGQLFKSLTIDSVNEGLNLLNVKLEEGLTELTQGLHFVKVSLGDQSITNKLIIKE